ncbi:MAG: type II/IV secretion system ATPase subunit [Candidatus Methanoperedens sp.]|nr:type II/IV secretion system ATPase subunit [Candidatus Methanoperedens sp.]MCZ7359749.1 type II/IV secretion system ATPase subunit [Candidatus Methanoperedens sp.]HLB70033.1 type II/IV secretion system ATPase subunit [Candidatus Methanoperedens sp.]
MTLEEAIKNNPHLGAYVREFNKKSGVIPDFVPQLARDIDKKNVNVIYPIGDPLFIHIFGTEYTEIKYYAIQPSMDQVEQEKYRQILDIILKRTPEEPAADTSEKLREHFFKLIDKVTVIDGAARDKEKIAVTREQFEKIKCFIDWNIVGHAVIEPVIRDPYLEDIHSIGRHSIFVVHKIFGMLETNLRFSSDGELDEWMRVMSERIGRPVSDFRPIADGALPDGSRINIIYSREVSRRGSSFTLRKFNAIPTSITQLIKWGSISAEIGAYLWLCTENGMNLFVSGETASGKTTALNSILPFINSKGKVYSVEDTAEVLAPQGVWQQMITRETGPKNTQVDMFSLLKLALRSRPAYVIVGEIRGVEGAVAFQAMQAGNSVMATFHASSVKKLIQRITGDPIKVPVTFIDNLHIVMILQAVYRQGVFLRRCVSLEEIEGYLEESKGVITRAVFQWDPINDRHHFRGLNNSYILENVVAQKLGYADKKKIYKELELRAKILEKMVEQNITDYYKVRDVIWAFERSGVGGLPFLM